MSLHKLTAGDGYTYLTRQVAAMDSTEKGHTGLADYYGQQGEAPGKWIGRGLSGLDGVVAGDRVTAEQMKALFGEGRHPDATQIEERVLAVGGSARESLVASALGRAFPIFEVAAGGFRARCAEAFGEFNAALGLPRGGPVPADERARIRTEVARAMFAEEHDRVPADPRELSGFIARASRTATTAVAGYDLTFSPVKSVSALWALAPGAVSERIEAAHHAAVADTLSWLEKTACFTRVGPAGIRQVETTGLIAATFTHRDSRAGDPDLHTHVAVSNKVQSLDGRWLALDGRVLHKAAVAASERYNTRLEAQLIARLGVRFAEWAGRDPRKRPVREIVGVDERLLTAWSQRRAAINTRRGDLASTFQAEHGRPPTAVEAIALAQQATLETRGAKHEPRSLGQQRFSWRREAMPLIGGPAGIDRMLSDTLTQHPAPLLRLTLAWVQEAAGRVLAIVPAERATWQLWHVQAEAERVVRSDGIAPGDVDTAVTLLVEEALSPARSIPLGSADPIDEPAPLRRSDGASVYTVAGSQLYTSRTVIDAEERLVQVAARTDGRVVDETSVELALLESAANGVELNPGQSQLVRELATSGARVQLAIAPAGSGKTTAMRVLARAWTDSGGDVVGLAPSAVAAAELGEQIGAHSDTLAKLTWSLHTGSLPDWVISIGEGTLVVIDEAGMAGTVDLARAVDFVLDRGGSVRLVGDDRQLAAIAAGGVLRDIAQVHGAVTLCQLIRFHDPAEAAATLALRAGEPAGLGFYLDRGRVHVGDKGTAVNTAYRAWAADRAAGRDAVMLAPTRDIVAELNARARADRLTTAGLTPEREVALADGNVASAGDILISRRNDRTVPITATDWVKNGDRWAVRRVHRSGALDVTHVDTRRNVTLQAAYVREHVELGYASTVHAAQGITAEVCHTVATGADNRQQLYVAMTRGRSGNHIYLAVAGDGDPHSVITPAAVRPPTATDILTTILGRDVAQRSATTTSRDLTNPAARLQEAITRYHDALGVAAETALGPDTVAWLDDVAEWVHNGLSHAPAWPALRTRLVLLTLDGHDPVAALTEAADARELVTAADPAAVLDWRLDPAAGRSESGGPLPWLAAVPAALVEHPEWGPYLTARAQLVTDRTHAVRDHAATMTAVTAPPWATGLLAAEHTELRADLAVWQAATGIPDHDLRRTGAPQPRATEAHHQRGLDNRTETAVAAANQAATTWAPLTDSVEERSAPPAAGAAAGGESAEGLSQRWTELARAIDPRLPTGEDWPRLAAAITRAHTAGYDVVANLPRLAAQQRLPATRPAAELFWRLFDDCGAAEPPPSRAAVPEPEYVPHHIRHPHEPPAYLRPDRDRDATGPER